ncbi:MAG: hypothetical protein ACXWPM_08160 [Bdellovibrionota bacterium]
MSKFVFVMLLFGMNAHALELSSVRYATCTDGKYELYLDLSHSGLSDLLYLKETVAAWRPVGGEFTTLKDLSHFVASGINQSRTISMMGVSRWYSVPQNRPIAGLPDFPRFIKLN